MSRTRASTPGWWPGQAALRWLTGAAASAVILAAMVGAPDATAAAAHISFDFEAAAPYSYNHQTGGGAWDDRTVGKSGDVVASLEGGDFNCGDIVTLLTAVTVADTDEAAAAQPMTAEIDFQFLMDTTGQSGVAVGDIAYVGVNYGTIEDLIAGENAVDDGFSDDGGSVATLLSESTTGPMYEPGSLLQGSVRLTDLERAERVILRVDVRLYCKVNSNPTGNLQADITSGRITHVNGTNQLTPPQVLSVGNQTIPFRQFGLIRTPDLAVSKTVTSVSGSCPGTELLVVYPGDQVRYCYEVSNPSLTTLPPGAPLYNVALVDDNGTPSGPTDDVVVPLTTGLTDIDLDGQVDDLAPGAVARGSYQTTVTGDPDSSLINTATATGTDSSTDGTQYTATDTAEVKFAIRPLPAIDIQKSPDYQMVIYGESATFEILVANAGNVPLTDVTVSDPLAPNCSRTIGALAVGASTSFTCTVGPVYASFENVATTEGHYGSTTVTDEDTAYVEDDILPDIEVSKSADPVWLPETGGYTTYTVVVSNVNGEIVDLISLADDRFGDLDGQGTCSVPQTLGETESYSCSFTKWLSSDLLVDHVDEVTAVAQDAQLHTDTATDDATVSFYDVAPAITVTKSADPVSVPETGGGVTFDVTVFNPGPEDVTLTSLVDNRFGNLDGVGSCEVPQSLAIGDSYSCAFTRRLSSDSLTTHVDTVTATAVDEEDSQATDEDDASVIFTDVPPVITVDKVANPLHVPETGGSVTFTVTLANPGPEDVTLTSLVDDMFGDLDGKGDCSLPQEIAISGSYTCSFEAWLASDLLLTHTDTATATAVDDEQTPATDEDTAWVEFDDVAPVISVAKSANPSSVPETGGDVTFTVRVDNPGPEDVTLTSLVDDRFGDLDGVGTCSVPQSIDIDGSYQCSFTQWLASDARLPHVDIATATAIDEEGTAATDDDSATVTFTDVPPVISVDKSADPASVPETGGDVTFTVRVDNPGPEDVTLTSLVDDVFGNLAGVGTCSVPQAIAIDGAYTCSFTRRLASDSLTAHEDEVTATAVDDEDTPATDADSARVTFTDVPPVITVVKSANPTRVPETGGDVTFTVRVDNPGPEDVTLTSLVDDVFGNLDGVGTCDVPQAIAVGDSYSCVFTRRLASDLLVRHTDTVTATAVDEEQSEASDFDSADVDFDDVAPVLQIVKSANPTRVRETGGNVTYTVTVSNPGPEDVTLTSLTDDVFGNLNGQGTCAIPRTVTIGGNYSCTFTKRLASDALVDHVNTATVAGVDEEGTEATASDDATVGFDDVLPDITVDKSVSPGWVNFAGGFVDYTIRISNNTAEALTLTEFGDTPIALSDECLDLIGEVIAPHGYLECQVADVWVSGAPDGSLVNTATATATDNDGNHDTASDTATVYFWWYGRTPGYWKNHPEAWVGFSPNAYVSSVFAIPPGLKTGGRLDLVAPTGEDTLIQALGYKGGTNLKGSGQNLLRAAVAAVLNEVYYGDLYPAATSVGALVTRVNSVLATEDRVAYLALAKELDGWNNANHTQLP